MRSLGSLAGVLVYQLIAKDAFVPQYPKNLYLKMPLCPRVQMRQQLKHGNVFARPELGLSYANSILRIRVCHDW